MISSSLALFVLLNVFVDFTCGHGLVKYVKDQIVGQFFCFDIGWYCLGCDDLCCSGYCEPNYWYCANRPGGGGGGGGGCIPEEASCSYDAQCCKKMCRHNECSIECYHAGRVCDGTWECCAGLECRKSRCENPCYQNGVQCHRDNECCNGLECRNNRCEYPCYQNGNQCNRDNECCSGTCFRNTCHAYCQKDMVRCTRSEDCCAGFCECGLCGQHCIPDRK